MADKIHKLLFLLFYLSGMYFRNLTGEIKIHKGKTTLAILEEKEVFGEYELIND